MYSEVKNRRHSSSRLFTDLFEKPTKLKTLSKEITEKERVVGTIIGLIIMAISTGFGTYYYFHHWPLRETVGDASILILGSFLLWRSKNYP